MTLIEVEPRETFRPLDAFAGSLAQRVYASLREAILELTLRPGEILRKPEICAALGVSRSPVSEALARLAQESLVDIVPQAGTFVARLSMDEVREGAFLREAVEAAAAASVAARASPEHLAELRRNLLLQEALAEAGDVQGFYALDIAMHELILGATGHRRLPALSRTLWVHVDRARRLLLPRPGRIRETVEEHRVILDAIAAADPAAARAATQRHLAGLLTRIEALAAERSELFG